MAQSSSSIVLYDLAGGPAEDPHKLTAPSPWKVRYALNLKGLDHRTEWVDMVDVPTVRQKLGVETKDRYPDGTPYYTLPILHDEATGLLIGETFDIAVYLEKTYPGGPALFPGGNGTVALTAAFDAYVEALFAPFAVLNLDRFPFNPATEREAKAKLVARFGKEKWDDLLVVGDARRELVEKFETELGKLAKYFEATPGPFLQGGDGPTFADFIVGARLMALQCALKEWDEVKTWQGGIWGRLHKALEPWREVK